MQRHVEETETRPVSYDGSEVRPILVNALPSKTGNDDKKPSPEQKKHSFKESTQSHVETQTVTVTAATDTKDPSNSLSKWKAMKNMSSSQVSTSVSSSSKARVDASRSSDDAQESSALEKPLVKALDDVKEPDNRRLESKS